jgi:hypothetical protein
MKTRSSQEIETEACKLSRVLVTLRHTVRTSPMTTHMPRAEQRKVPSRPCELLGHQIFSPNLLLLLLLLLLISVIFILIRSAVS